MAVNVTQMPKFPEVTPKFLGNFGSHRQAERFIQEYIDRQLAQSKILSRDDFVISNGTYISG